MRDLSEKTDGLSRWVAVETNRASA